ncbi:MAG: ammonium transporter [Myxococcales bacterium]|nr:ammonium transporter [Myxococcales bacterium]
MVPLLLLTAPAWAQDDAPAVSAADAMFTADNIWMMVSTFLVFIMHLGFASVETGLTRAKNTVNILFKNTVIVAIGLLTYAAVGFNLMYPGGDYAGAWFGFAGFGISLPEGGDTLAYNGHFTYWTDFLFQGMFAATAATIVSGAVAERVKLGTFLLFSAIYVAVVYPIVGMWGWGGGWLAARGFHDFAGSTFVHSVGGWAALAGVLVLGPRLGKYSNGTIYPIMGHNLPLATAGMFFLWLGWFGFNGGSVLSADAATVSLVLVTTTLAAAAGLISSMAVSWIVQKKPDHTMILNGTLAGLVGITAGADCVTPMQSIIIGAVAGIIVVGAVIAIDRAKIDDPVGAISVHLVCGVWGTLAVGIWGEDYSLATQAIGVVVPGVVCFTVAFALFFVLKKTIGLRVPADEELRGLDLGEHGQEAYAGFQIF